MSLRIRRHLSAADPVLAGLIEAAGPLRLQQDLQGSPFRHLVRAIAHQQITGAVAKRVLERLVALYGSRDGFPTPAQLLETPDEALRGVGFSYAKVAALKDLAAKTLEGVVPDAATLLALGDEEIIERVSTVRGIGRWTVEMMLIFQFGRPDVLPVDDFGVRNGFRLAYGLRGLPTPRALAAFGERWAPYRSAAAWYFWRACDLAREGRLPAPPKRRPRILIVKPRVVTPARVAASAARPRRSDERTRRPALPAPRSRARASRR